MLEIVPGLNLPETELDWSYARAGGPGGQNVNKVSSKAVLRWNFAASLSIPPEVKLRFQELFPTRITTEGEVVISSQEFRDQERNRDACTQKLLELLRKSTIRPKSRKKTKPSKGSQRRRLEDKKRQSTRRADRETGAGE